MSAEMRWACLIFITYAVTSGGVVWAWLEMVP
jgi:hypothetical protein